MNVLLLAGDGRGLLEIVPLHSAMQQRNMRGHVVYAGGPIETRLQHGVYRELGASQPELTLHIDAVSDAQGIARAAEQFSEHLESNEPDAVAVSGASDPVLACCLAAARRGVPIIRLDAGRRGETRGQRIHVILDRLAEHLFVSDPEAMAALLGEGISKESATFVGNLFTDAVARLLDAERIERLLSVFNLKGQAFALVYLEEWRGRRTAAIELLQSVADHIQVVHLVDSMLEPLPALPGVRTIASDSLRELLILVESARMVITDADLVQEAAAFREVPCLTVGRPVVREVTVTSGCNRTVPFNPPEAARRVRHLLDESHACSAPPLWDGAVADRIVDVLVRGYGQRLAQWIAEYFIERHRARRS